MNETTNICNFCANCSLPLMVRDDAINNNQIVREIVINVPGQGSYSSDPASQESLLLKETTTITKTVKVHTVLSRLYNLNILNGVDYHLTPLFNGQDEQDIGLCPACAPIVTQMYLLYIKFNQLRRDSYLSKKVNRLNEICMDIRSSWLELTSTESQQQQLLQDEAESHYNQNHLNNNNDAVFMDDDYDDDDRGGNVNENGQVDTTSGSQSVDDKVKSVNSPSPEATATYSEENYDISELLERDQSNFTVDKFNADQQISLFSQNLATTNATAATTDLDQLGLFEFQDRDMLQRVLQSAGARELLEILSPLTFETTDNMSSLCETQPGDNPGASTDNLSVPVNQPADSTVKDTYTNSIESPVEDNAATTNEVEISNDINEEDIVGGSKTKIRRSQRQLDRNEREETGKILAENQQMLQREKEEAKVSKDTAMSTGKSKESPPRVTNDQNESDMSSISSSSILGYTDDSMLSLSPITSPENFSDLNDSNSNDSSNVAKNSTPKSLQKDKSSSNHARHRQNSGEKKRSSRRSSDGDKHTFTLKDEVDAGNIIKKNVPTKSKTDEKRSHHGKSASPNNSDRETKAKQREIVKKKESSKESKKGKNSVRELDGESLTKKNMRKAISETFKMRLKVLTEEEKDNFPLSNTPAHLADIIEKELTLHYGGVNNTKCKAKYRSIYFNLRDARNTLFREILVGNIEPKTLVKMDPTEMASKELTEWRNRESEKNLENLKQAAFDTLDDAKKQNLSEKLSHKDTFDVQVDFDLSQVTEQSTPIYDISESSFNPNESNFSSLTDNRHEPFDHDARCRKHSVQEMPSSSSMKPIESRDYEREVFAFRTNFMFELGCFGAKVYHMSHYQPNGQIFPDSPVPIVGRVPPKNAWDYIEKIKNTKDVILLRLTPDTPDDEEGFTMYFDYLSSRERFGVVGDMIAPLKDVYLIPLDRQNSDTLRTLFPFLGFPILQQDENRCLLAVVIRHLPPVASMLPVKRQASISNSSSSLSPISTSPKKKKVITENIFDPVISTESSSVLITNQNEEGPSQLSAQDDQVEKWSDDDDSIMSKVHGVELNKNDTKEPLEDEPMVICCKLPGENTNITDSPDSPSEDEDDDVIILESCQSCSLQQK